MKIAGLFAGIGGIEAGFAKAGFETALLCENWAPAVCVLRTQYPNALYHDNVTSLNKLPNDIRLITAGFPCQDLSQAGLTKGLNGKQSTLVSHVFRLLDENRIDSVLLENVPFMLHLNHGKAVESILTALEDRGYSWAYRTINSLSYLPQRRERVFIFATKTRQNPEDILLSVEFSELKIDTDFKQFAHGFYWTEGLRGLGWAVNAVPTLKKGSTVGIPSPPAVIKVSGNIIKPDIRDAERLQGFKANWTSSIEKNFRSSLRWSLVGNAVTVPVAEFIAKQMLSPGIYDADRDRDFPASKKWPSAARGRKGKRIAVEISNFVSRQNLNLESFLKFEGTKLSEKATSGFLKRAQKSSLRFHPQFLEKVKSHLDTYTATQQTLF